MKKILVIEDEKLVQFNIMKILQYEGFDAIAAENGEVGIRLAKEITPDLILCDIMMPVINGYDVQTELRQDPCTQSIPFIFLTAKVEREDMRLGMNLGADDYLPKPFSRDELLETIFSRLDKQESIHQHFQAKVDQIKDNITTSLPKKLFVPLEQIRSFLNQLQSDTEVLPPHMREALTRSNDSMQTLERYLQNFFFYSILETTKQNPTQAAAIKGDCITQCEEIITEVVKNKATEYGRNSEIEVEISPCALPILEANLVNIAEELVDNSFKFSPPGSQVSVRSEIESGKMILTIINEMQQEDAQSTQNHSHTQTQPIQQHIEGAGLGLAIVKQLVDLHDGQLKIESETGRSVIVTVEIPIVHPHVETRLENTNAA